MIQKSEKTQMHQNINGYLKYRSEWSENVASQLAEQDGLTLTDKHWDVIEFLRTEFYANKGHVPLEQEIKKGMEHEWNTAISYKELTTLFPGGSNRQGAKIAGCITLQTVNDLLAIKGGSVWSVEPTQPLLDALSIMSKQNIGAVMVVKNEELVGLVSERDHTRHVVSRDRSSHHTKVQDIMTKSVISISKNETLEQCMALMTERNFRHLPVLNNGRLIGVVSMPDIVRIIVQQQQLTISRLENRSELECV